MTSLTAPAGRRPDPPIERVPRQIRGVLASLSANPGSRRSQLIIGTAGSGKTTTLHAVRRTLKELGLRTCSHVEVQLDDYDAVVLDDGHRLTDGALGTVCELADAGTHTIIFATEPRHRNAALSRALSTLERETEAIRLEPLSRDEIAAQITEASGAATSPSVLEHIGALTAGNPALVNAALSGARGTPGGNPKTMAKTIERAIRERLYKLEESEVATVLLCSLRTDVGASELTSVLGVSATKAEHLMDVARCTGFTDGSLEWSERVYSAAVNVIGRGRRHEIESLLLATRLEQGPLSGAFALQLASHGITDQRLVRPLIEAAVSAKPTQAAAYYDAAARIGPDIAPTRLLAAESRACAGDLTGATRAVDSLWDIVSEDSKPVAVRIAASASAIRGNTVRAADLYRWLGPNTSSSDVVAAALQLSIGDVTAGRDALEATATPATNPPHTRSAVDRLIVQGLVESIDASASTALNTLTRAAALEQGTATTTIGPDRSAAIAATMAMHVGQLPRARALLSQWSVDDVPPVHRVRHQLLMAWVALFEGDLATAAAQSERLGQSTVHLRDQLSRGGLRVALARRSGDFGELRSAWDAVCEPLSEYSVDLYGLLPIGEIWVAAARLQVTADLAPILGQMRELLAKLGNPATWSASMRWYGVHAAIAADSPAEVMPHAQALAEAARTSTYAGSLARAGRVWIHVLGGNIDPADVDAAARGLAEVGHTWDGSRLASQAALYASDPRVASTMLQLARSMRTHQNATPENTDRPTTHAPTAVLSDREREVVALLLLGITYKDIGDRLFISAKTVEHHVARIRRRIGAQSRSEMLSILRAMHAEQGSDQLA